MTHVGRTMRSLPSIFTVFFVTMLSGCGKTLNVRVRHPPLENIAARYREAAFHPYVLLRIPRANANAIGKSKTKIVFGRSRPQAEPIGDSAQIDGYALDRK